MKTKRCIGFELELELDPGVVHLPEEVTSPQGDEDVATPIGKSFGEGDEDVATPIGKSFGRTTRRLLPRAGRTFERRRGRRHPDWE
jgi:hypothetical protein